MSKQPNVTNNVDSSEEFINCLRNEKVRVRFVKQNFALARERNHVFTGGKADNAVDYLTTPVTRSGQYVNVLTNDEMKFLEHQMGLPKGALSVYRKEDNYWDTLSIPLVGKSDTILDLSIPEDYIMYKALLANKYLVCGSAEELKAAPKRSYRYVLIRENEAIESDNIQMNNILKATVRFGELKNDYPTIKFITEMVVGKPISRSTGLDFIQNQCFDKLQQNPKVFLSFANDPLLDTKVLIRECVEYGIVRRQANFYYVDNKPLCNDNAEPTLDVAAKYINMPINNELKLSLEARLKATKE